MAPGSYLLPAVVFCLSAVCSFGHGDLHEQIAQLTIELQQAPKNAVLYHKRAELHRAHCEYREAFEDYNAAERIDPKLDVVHLSRGRTMLEAGRPVRAEIELTTFLSLHPGNSEALLLRGRAFNRLGRHRDADADYAKAIDLSPEASPDLYLERAANRDASGESAAALTIVEQAIFRFGSLVTLEDPALNLELKLHRYDAALKRLDEMLVAAPRKEALLERKGRILKEAGHESEAQEAFRAALSAIELLPSNHRRTAAITALESDLRSRLEQN